MKNVAVIDLDRYNEYLELMDKFDENSVIVFDERIAFRKVYPVERVNEELKKENNYLKEGLTATREELYALENSDAYSYRPTDAIFYRRTYKEELFKIPKFIRRIFGVRC